MTENSSLTIPQTIKTQAAVSTTQPEPKLWETELFQLSAMGGVIAVLMIWASLCKKKPQLTSARMANRWDKLYATNRAFEHMKATAETKCSPSAAWCGTPKYSYKFLGLKWASRLQVILHNTMPTTWIPDIGRGVLVLGSPGSGKTFSFIDRVIEALFAQGVSVLLYDKKGDQMKLHTSLASRYGYTVDVFAPGGVGLETGEDINTPGGDYWTLDKNRFYSRLPFANKS